MGPERGLVLGDELGAVDPTPLRRPFVLEGYERSPHPNRAPAKSALVGAVSLGRFEEGGRGWAERLEVPDIAKYAVISPSIPINGPIVGENELRHLVVGEPAGELQMKDSGLRRGIHLPSSHVASEAKNGPQWFYGRVRLRLQTFCALNHFAALRV